MKMSFFKYLFIFLVLAFVTYACVKKTTYPTTPVIEYSDFIPFVGDSADLRIKFTDGDGDIGASENDSTRNFWYTYYYKDTITHLYRGYVIYDANGNEDTLRSGYIIKEPEGGAYSGKPISGEVSVRLQKFRHSKKIKNVKYVFYLIDKAGNKSNVASSPEISVP